MQNKENLKKTNAMRIKTSAATEKKSASQAATAGDSLQIGVRRIAARPRLKPQGAPAAQPETKAISYAMQEENPQKATQAMSENEEVLSENGKTIQFAPRVSIRVPHNHAAVNEKAEAGDYQFDQPLAMGAESMLFTGQCAGETVVIKSVRSKLNRWLGNAHTRDQEIKLTKAKYSVKTKHILNEFQVGRLLYNEKDIPVVHIYAIHRHKFLCFDLGYDLVMEYLPGNDLGNQLMVQQLSTEEKLKICIQAFRAVNYLHSRHLVHLDIKPTNFMYCQGVLKLFDFGISTVGGSKINSIMGTAGYLSPEQIARDVVNEATDLFALGVTLSTLFGGRPINQHLEDLHSHSAKETAKYNMDNDEASVVTDMPELDAYPGFADILKRCSILKRTTRTQTSKAVMYQLKAWAKSEECTFDVNLDW